VKPRAMAASFGVSLASDQEQVRHAFGVANVQLLHGQPIHLQVSRTRRPWSKL
jgi:hypothetical protein